MSDNKLVKTVMETGILTDLTAGIGCLGKKAFDKSFTKHPSNSFENFVLFTTVMSGATALKQYLVDEKIIKANW